VTDRKDFSNGPVWDPQRERYLVEVRFPDSSRKKKRFRRQREAPTLVDSGDRENRGWKLERIDSEKCYPRHRIRRIPPIFEGASPVSQEVYRAGLEVLGD
jgi:hypothetical protein